MEEREKGFRKTQRKDNWVFHPGSGQVLLLVWPACLTYRICVRRGDRWVPRVVEKGTYPVVESSKGRKLKKKEYTQEEAACPLCIRGRYGYCS